MPEKRTYPEFLAKNGGLATTGNHLGVMVAPRNKARNCPPGWVFVPMETATPEIVREALDVSRKGRSDWPD